MPDVLFDEAALAIGGEAPVGAAPVAVIGVDLASTKTGVAYPAPGTAGVGETREIAEPESHKDWAELRRLRWMRDAVCAFAAYDYDAPKPYRLLVVIEGLIYGGKISPYYARSAAVHWMVRDQITDWPHVRIVVVNPSTRCVFAIGKGRARKADIVREVTKRYPAFHGGEDEADALVLRAMGCHWTGRPIVPLPATHTRALAAVTWPAPWTD